MPLFYVFRFIKIRSPIKASIYYRISGMNASRTLGISTFLRNLSKTIHFAPITRSIRVNHAINSWENVHLPLLNIHDHSPIFFSKNIYPTARWLLEIHQAFNYSYPASDYTILRCSVQSSLNNWHSLRTLSDYSQSTSGTRCALQSDAHYVLLSDYSQSTSDGHCILPRTIVIQDLTLAKCYRWL